MPKRAPQPQADTSSECTDGRGPRQESVRGCRDEPAAATCFDRRHLGGLLDLRLSSLRAWGDCPGTCTGGGIKHSCIKNTRILKFIFPFSIFHVFFFSSSPGSTCSPRAPPRVRWPIPRPRSERSPFESTPRARTTGPGLWGKVLTCPGASSRINSTSAMSRPACTAS